MIFKQVQEIIDGTKTETRRVMKPNETYAGFHDECVMINADVPYGNTRLKWVVGRDYAVQPGRGQSGLHYDIETHMIYGHGYEPFRGRARRWPCIVPLRIKILDIRRERLQSITRVGAIAEGVDGLSPVGDYCKLWESINGAGSWGKNPHVWVINFEVLRE